MAPGITRGGKPITGVYARGRLATGVYARGLLVWPAAAAEGWAIGIGRFEFAPCGLLAETGHSIRLPAAALAFTGCPLEFAASGAVGVALQPGALALSGLSLAPRAGVATALQPGALGTSAGALAIVSGLMIPAITGALAFAPQALVAAVGSSIPVAVAVQPGALAFAPQAFAAVAGAAVPVGGSALALSGLPLVAQAGGALAVAVGAAQITVSPAALTITVAAASQLAAGSVAFAGAQFALAIGQGVNISVGPSSVTLTGTALFSSGGASMATGAGVLIFVGGKLLYPSGSITLTAALPATATIGSAYTGSVTATLVDGAAGPITSITLAGLPSGVTAGTLTQVDAVTWKRNVSGTVTGSTGTANWTANATNGSVSATQIGGSVVVSETPIGVVPIQVAVASSASSIAALVATLSNVQKDDVIVAVLEFWTSQPSWTYNLTDAQSNTYAQLLRQTGSGNGNNDVIAWATTVANGASNLNVSQTVTGRTTAGLLTVYQFRGVSQPIAAACVGSTTNANQAPGTQLTSPAFALSAGGIAITGAVVTSSGVTPTFSPVTPNAGTYASDSALGYSTSIGMVGGHVTGMGAQSAATIAYAPNPSSSYWRGTCVVVPVNPK